MRRATVVFPEADPPQIPITYGSFKRFPARSNHVGRHKRPGLVSSFEVLSVQTYYISILFAPKTHKKSTLPLV
jgi:hypothetical protein